MKGMAKLIAGLALLGASFSTSANTWADGVEIEVLKLSAGGTFIITPVGAPVPGCTKFRFAQNVMNLTAQGQKFQYAMVSLANSCVSVKSASWQSCRDRCSALPWAR
jgi:hypothetical protein